MSDSRKPKGLYEILDDVLRKHFGETLVVELFRRRVVRGSAETIANLCSELRHDFNHDIEWDIWSTIFAQAIENVVQRHMSPHASAAMVNDWEAIYAKVALTGNPHTLVNEYTSLYPSHLRKLLLQEINHEVARITEGHGIDEKD